MTYKLIEAGDLIYQTNDPKIRTTEKTALDCIWYYTLGECSLSIQHSHIILGIIKYDNNTYVIESQGYKQVCDNLKEAQEYLLTYVTTGVRSKNK